MLKSLSIQNIVLINKAEIDFLPGLCILSGETGSGKSILLDALGLAIGFRSNLRLIGKLENKAFVNAYFDISKNKDCQKILKDNDLLTDEDANLLHIRRVIDENSSSKVYINDQQIGVNLLAKIGETLIEIHGQGEQHGLLNPSNHLAILDEFAQSENLLKNLKENYNSLKEIDEKISAIKAKADQIKQEKDYLEYSIRELENADVRENEETELVTKKDQIGAKEKIINFLSDLRSNLLQSNSESLLAQRILIRNQNIIANYLSEKKDEFEKISDEIDKQTSSIQSAISVIQETEKNILNSDDGDLEEVEERLFFVRSLARKFNCKTENLPQIILEFQEKLSSIKNEEESCVELENQRLALLQTYKKFADELSEKRKKSAVILSKKIEEELKFLKMESVLFKVELTKNIESEYSLKGYERARFLSSINHNNFDDISKIASGGELSRFMLAVKVSLMNVKSPPTMIFDEIDSGIGGNVADAVGKRLKTLSQKVQILVVTHQPQIAAKADVNYKISKIKENTEVKTVIEKLDSDAHKVEIARMLSGEKISKEAIVAAENLILESRNIAQKTA